MRTSLQIFFLKEIDTDYGALYAKLELNMKSNIGKVIKCMKIIHLLLQCISR